MSTTRSHRTAPRSAGCKSSRPGAAVALTSNSCSRESLSAMVADRLGPGRKATGVAVVVDHPQVLLYAGANGKTLLGWLQGGPVTGWVR